MRLTRRIRGLKLIALLGLVVSSAAYWYTQTTSESLLKRARAAELQGDHRLAVEYVSRALQRDRHSVEALLFAGAMATRAGDSRQALDYYRQLPETASGPQVAERLKDAGQLAIRDGRASDSEFFYQRALRLLPDDQMVHRRLGALYLGEARRWESTPHLLALLKEQAFTLEELAFLGSSEELYEAERLMAFFEESVPDDLVPLMGRARLYLFKGFNEKGESLLRQILAQQPDLIEAQSQLGVVLVSESRTQDFEAWHRQLPRAAYDHPEIWWVLGTHARKHGDSPAAIRCAWESLRLDPNHLGATYQLAQLMAADGRPTEAKVLAERASKLESLATAIHEVLLREATASRMLRCARTCEDLGRLWEAWGWYVTIDTYHPEQAVVEDRQRLKALLTPDTPRTLPSHDLARQFDFSNYPLPQLVTRSSPEGLDNAKTISRVRFEEVTAAVGLDFAYENGAPHNSPGFMVYQSVGGGVAVIDYDGDGAPDLFFPQASQSPMNSAAVDASDRLYRNVAGQCVDISDIAIPRDSDYGFGATVGDFDCDGFPDLYIANAGRNRLLRNNGDGVFSDVTNVAGLEQREWTASCLMADLNGDGLPDLYDVNYCTGARMFEHECFRAGGRLRRTCIPTEFEAADDALLLNLGDGRFQEMGQSAGLYIPDGRGLGIVAANFDDVPGLDLYIANDMTANFLFLNRTAVPGGLPRFDERGVLSGTAYDFDGRPQASMGIAADDADGDGRLDLFVTNFYNESNTFYHQQPGRFFVDATRDFDLRNPSLSLLAFGTQFLDADLDGRPDLVVANGHVDDYSDEGIPFRMKPQFYSNQGKKFVEVSSEQLGPFFCQAQLGRGLARLDWNRDGRDDFVISRLLDPAALVINRTTSVGHYLAVRLVGLAYRDAIGSEVRVTAGGRMLVKQLMAGDGFECSNERRLVFGLAEAKSVDEIRIRWPGGVEEIFTNLSIDQEVLFVEGSNRPRFISDKRL